MKKVVKFGGSSLADAKQFQVYTDNVEETIQYFKNKGKAYSQYFKVKAQSNAQAHGSPVPLL